MTSEMKTAMQATPTFQYLSSPSGLLDKVLFPSLRGAYSEGFWDGWAAARFAPVSAPIRPDHAPSSCGRVTRDGIPALAGMGAVPECTCVRPAEHDDVCACAHEAPADAIPTASDRTDAAKIEAAARAIDPDAWTMSAAEFEAEYGGSADWSEQSQAGRIEGSKTLAELALEAAGAIGRG